MAEFFEVYNDAGSLLLDATYSALAVRYTGTSNTWSPLYSGAATQVTTVTVAADTPIIAIRSTAYVSLLRVTKSGDYWSFSLISKSAAASVDWLVFDKTSAVPPPAASGAGLQLFDADGRKSFDSDYRYINVVDVAQVFYADIDQTGEDAVASTRAQYAIIGVPYTVVFEEEHWHQGDNPDDNEGYYTYSYGAHFPAIRFSGNTLYVGDFVLNSSSMTPEQMHASWSIPATILGISVL